jgi:hypothetical protein
MSDTNEIIKVLKDNFSLLHKKADNFTDELDRFHDELKLAKESIKKHEELLGKMNRSAIAITQQAKVAGDSWEQAEAIAKAAGVGASESAVEGAKEALKTMTNGVSGAITAANNATKKLSNSILKIWIWVAITIALCGISTGLSVYLTYKYANASFLDSRAGQLIQIGMEREKELAAPAGVNENKVPSKKLPHVRGLPR